MGKTKKGKSKKVYKNPKVKLKSKKQIKADKGKGLIGRPTVYTKKTFDRICEEISEGKSLNKIAKEDWSPHKRTFYKWIREEEGLSDQYGHAKQDRADTYADEIVDIADYSLNDKSVDDDGHTVINHDVIQRSRLRIDARKWIACKLHPRNYGEKKSIDLTGTQTNFNVDLSKDDLKEATGNLKKMLEDSNF